MTNDSHRWPVSLSLALCVGCGSDVVPVSGRVTLDGQPLAGAVVTFQPFSGRDPSHAISGSVGRTNEEGRFSLRLVEPDIPGASVGEHTVSITTATIDPEEMHTDDLRAGGERVPKAWRDGSQRFTVAPGGTTSANFDLTTPPPEPKSERRKALP